MYANYLALTGRTLQAARFGPSDLLETVPLPRIQHVQNKGIPDDLWAVWLPPPAYRFSLSAPMRTNFVVMGATTKVVPIVTSNIPIEIALNKNCL
jgi:hypothetical protein